MTWLIVLIAVGFLLTVGTVGLWLSQARRNEELSRSISVAVEYRTPFLRDHHDLVSDLAVVVGSELGLNRRELHDLKCAAHLMHIGLTNIRMEILQKEGEWTAADEAVYERHPEIGAAIVKTIAPLKHLSHIVQFHRAKFETVENIPMESQILVVCSDYLQLCKELPTDRALLVMQRQAGLMYDPLVIDTLRLALKAQNSASLR